jgi:hypothetical protein
MLFAMAGIIKAVTLGTFEPKFVSRPRFIMKPAAQLSLGNTPDMNVENLA